MLKVGSPQPPMDDMPPMDMGGQPEGSEFDTNFDAGVDADEETDPKKYIQQLTGKLSQTLRKYNSEQSQPDADLSKYVCGMIVKQAIEGLNNEDTEEILKKIKSDDTDSKNGQPEEMSDEMQPQPPMDDDQNQMPMESVDRRMKIDEIFQDLTKDSEDETSYREVNNKQKGFRLKPFTSPNFR